MTAAKNPAKLDLPKSAKFVTVASKLPMHLQLQLCEKTTRNVPGRYGSEPETVFVKTGPLVFIRGTAEPNGQAPKGYKRATIENDFALTKNVPADFFAAWLEQNKETDLVRSGLIYAHSSPDHVEGETAERSELNSWMGPIDPDNIDKDPRTPKPIDASTIIGVTSDTESMGAR